jgi:hypothetical protein
MSGFQFYVTMKLSVYQATAQLKEGIVPDGFAGMPALQEAWRRCRREAQTPID